MKRLFLCLTVFLLNYSGVSEARKKKVLTKENVARELTVSKKQRADTVDFSHDVSFAGSDAFDPEKKRSDVEALVKKGVSFLEKHTIIELLRALQYTSDFEKGELSLAVYESNGMCLAQGKDTTVIWQNCLEQKDLYGTFFIKKMIEIARKGGGWTSYEWQDATRLVYVRMVKKDDKEFIISSGYFPQTKKATVIALVKGAVSTFYKVLENGGKMEDAFSQFSYPGGKFVSGELYIYVIDTAAVIRANGFDPSEIGVSYWDEKDAKGVYYLREIAQRMASAHRGEGQWFEFEYYNAQEQDYVERVVDKQGKSYFVICGYNPLASKDKAIELTKKAKAAVQERGIDTVVAAINDFSNQEFVYGRMTVFIYATDGTVIANGERPSLVGKNSLYERDETGSFYVKDLIEKVEKEKEAWLSFLSKRAIVSVYSEQLSSDGKNYVIGASYFPLSKESLVVLLVKSAKFYLSSVSEEKAFKLFNDPTSKFTLGDLSIFVYAPDGTCYADGYNQRNTWKNRLQEKDAEGRTFIKTMIDNGMTAPVKVYAQKDDSRMIMYAEATKKNEKSFIVGSGYYQ